MSRLILSVIRMMSSWLLAQEEDVVCRAKRWVMRPLLTGLVYRSPTREYVGPSFVRLAAEVYLFAKTERPLFDFWRDRRHLLWNRVSWNLTIPLMLSHWQTQRVKCESASLLGYVKTCIN